MKKEVNYRSIFNKFFHFQNNKTKFEKIKKMRVREKKAEEKIKTKQLKKD